MFILIKNGKGYQKTNCNIAINQQLSLPTLDRSAPETKTKYQKPVEAACRGQENYMKKLKEKL